MEIKPKFQFVEGSFDTQRVKLLCIRMIITDGLISASKTLTAAGISLSAK